MGLEEFQWPGTSSSLLRHKTVHCLSKNTECLIYSSSCKFSFSSVISMSFHQPYVWLSWLSAYFSCCYQSQAHLTWQVDTHMLRFKQSISSQSDWKWCSKFEIYLINKYKPWLLLVIFVYRLEASQLQSNKPDVVWR